MSARDRSDAPPLTAGLRPARSPRFVLAGVLAVLVSAVAFWVTSVRVDPKSPVLALSGPVAAGQVISAADLIVVRIVPDPALQVVPESQRDAVIGRTPRQPLSANTLLSESMLGPAAWPPAGQSLIALPVKSGRMPAEVIAGAQVLVLIVPSAEAAGAADDDKPTQRASAVVVSVGSADAGEVQVVSLLAAESDAVRIASASGEVSLVMQTWQR
ncbi:hypothetical protein Aca07nite_87730 [Actinoplanes capillaceus]|uniref:SAF domain-containing protein n=1 Tax=Actinoplanes campanulatus TaxID=113559 RepID=A0ABQ3WZC4_9ACTN|nr:SAF domain-containing protein [Actinoplanes capillaceus]GID51498.1 hypothetical protein Aca07nite_87730 [Actinoplanes capillaceus]